MEREDALEAGACALGAVAIEQEFLLLLRQLLDRIEDAATGDLLLPELRADPPPGAVEEATALAGALADQGPASPFPVVEGLVLQGRDPAEQALRTAWWGSLAVVGADGLPPAEVAGAVLRPSTTLKLVIRLPPTVDADRAAGALERALTADPPNGAQVGWALGQAAGGWW